MKTIKVLKDSSLDETIEMVVTEIGKIDVCIHINGIHTTPDYNVFYNRVIISKAGNYISDIIHVGHGVFWSKGYYADPVFHKKGIN